MTDLTALRERYSPKPVPKCHICGAEMTVQRMSASRITYGCTGATYDDKGCHYAEGRSIADDHYEQSRVTVVDVSDPEVLALLDDLEAAEKRIAEHNFENRLLANADRDIKALRQRIEELEARTVNLPAACADDEYFIDGVFQPLRYERDVERAIRAAGIGMKGE
ncbi:ead/Ea22-like family protein [Citrobacter freundii]